MLCLAVCYCQKKADCTCFPGTRLNLWLGLVHLIFKFVYKVGGGHTHVRMFSGKSAVSLGLCGTLVMRNEEWEEFTACITAPNFLFEEQITSGPAIRGNNDCHQD